MAVHIGIDPDFGELSYYKEGEEKKINCRITKVDANNKDMTAKNNDIEEVKSMFKDIKKKINGVPGYACIRLNGYDDEMEKHFIEVGLEWGFKSVEIIDRYVAYYLNAISKSSYKPANRDVIWLENSCTAIDIWEVTDSKSKYIGTGIADNGNIDDIFQQSVLKKWPNIVFLRNFQYWKKDFQEKNIKCKFFKIKISNHASDGSLVKALTASGNPDYVVYDITKVLMHDAIFTIGETTVAEYKIGQELPTIFSQKFEKESNENELILSKSCSQKRSFKLPYQQSFFITIKIDTNQIYSVNFHLLEQPVDEQSAATTASTTVSQIPVFPSVNYFMIPKLSHQAEANVKVIGIDLGTSKCCAAVNRRNGITTVPLNDNGERFLPTYVSYDEENVKCGKVVVNRLRQFSKSTIIDSKRIIGKALDDIEIDEKWNFNVISENNKVFIQIQGINGEKKIGATEVAAEFLKVIKQKAENFQGVCITSAVITIPSEFTEAQKADTVEAATLAGLKEVYLLPDAVAVALAFVVDQPIPHSFNVLIVDLGGGYLDVSVYKVLDDYIETVSNITNSNIGGQTFDAKLMAYFKSMLGKHGISISNNNKYKLMLDCQRIKEDLTTFSNTSLNINDYDTHKQGMIAISREEFQKICQQLLVEVRNVIQLTLLKSSYTSGQIEKVLHTGGGIRMPMMKELLQKMFPQAEHRYDEYPGETTAIGAAYFACSIFHN